MRDLTDIGLETKFSGPDTQPVLSDAFCVEGYASLFGQTDRGGDIVESGAYAASLAAVTSKGGRIKMLWQHDPTQPIGVWEEVREDDRGLFVKGRLLPDVALAREAAALLDAGAIDGLSIGYRTVRATKDTSGNRRLTELELWEVSLVTFPMLPEARVGAKGDDADQSLMRDLASAIDTARRDFAQG